MVAEFSVTFLLLAGCTAAEDSAPEPPEPTSATTAPVFGADCPTDVGQACLGALAAGTYTTTQFEPRLTYTVSDGWVNYDDTEGIVHLVPADFTRHGINAGTSDYIGVYSNVAPAADCSSTLPDGVARTPAAIADWFAQHPGLVVEGRSDVTVGGLQGVVADLRVASDWTQTCTYSNGEPVVPYLTGFPPSQLEHNLPKGQAVRLYLLANGTDVLGIEAIDVYDAGHLDAYSAVVDTFAFDGSSEPG